MTQELIINGCPVDLLPGTDLTLEYVSGLFQDFGKINLSRSYTVKLPKTRRNTEALDSPGIPGYESSLARRYFDARYYRNGVDLLGEARAYIIRTTDEAYEVGLLWNSSDALVTLSESGKKLTDITTLPLLPKWKGASLATAATTDGVFFASYFSGAPTSGDYDVNAAPHPCITIFHLLDRILDNAGVTYTISDDLATELKTTALLIAPSHRPNLLQELASASQASALAWYPVGEGNRWFFSEWTAGWDAPYEDNFIFRRGTSGKVRIILNLAIEGQTPDLYLSVEHLGSPIILRPTSPAPGVYLIDEEVDLGDLKVNDEMTGYTVNIHGLEAGAEYTVDAYLSDRPLFAAARVHDEISIANDNRFPVAENLPDLTQLDFLKACFALYGIAPTITRGGVLVLKRYDEALSLDNAVDWTRKQEMKAATTHGNTLDGHAQQSRILWEEDTDLPFDPTIILETEDATIARTADLAKLPFAGSAENSARHYTITGEYNDETQAWDYTAETIDIKPRIFGWTINEQGYRQLDFPASLWGEGSRAAHYARYQEAVRKPSILETVVRLSELDLAELDLSRPVYLGALGHYYSIISVQTSSTDACKVKLIKID